MPLVGTDDRFLIQLYLVHTYATHSRRALGSENEISWEFYATLSTAIGVLLLFIRTISILLFTTLVRKSKLCIQIVAT